VDSCVRTGLRNYSSYVHQQGPPLWSSGQSSRVRFPELPDFLRSSVFGTGSTQEVIVAVTVYKTENTAVEIRCADHATPSIRKSWH
jgi:hypothetical protein